MGRKGEPRRILKDVGFGVAVEQQPDSVDHAGADAAARFHISLRELRDLRRQLHRAADHCEAAYKRTTAKQKRTVVENTRKYICEAVVRVVDHLGSVAASVEGRLPGRAELVETERRIDSLRQRLTTCRQYAASIDLASLRWNPELPRHRAHYVIIPRNISGQVDGSSNGDPSQHDFNLPTYTSESPSNDHAYEYGASSLPSNQLVLSTPRRRRSHSLTERELLFMQTSLGSPAILSNPCPPSPGYGKEDTQRRDDRKKKRVQGGNFVSFLWRSKRAA